MTITRPHGAEEQQSNSQSKDLDVITVSGNFSARTVYNGSIALLNKTETPPDNVEVEEEADAEHQFITSGQSLSGRTEYSNVDSNGKPTGTESTFSAGDESMQILYSTLRHDLKPNDGTLADAGGGN